MIFFFFFGGGGGGGVLVFRFVFKLCGGARLRVFGE